MVKINMNLDLGAPASAEDWVKTSRLKERDAKAEAKRLAELKKKQLEEEEDELVEQSSSMYNSSHLKGLKVTHGITDFEEGQEVVLTLKDTSILAKDDEGKIIGLNEDGDELENVNLADKDRRLERESKKRRLNQPVYSALDDYEFQNGAPTGTRAPLLPQYEREKRAAAKLELGADGMAVVDPTVSTSAVRAQESAANVQSLLAMSKQASDYYTAKEYTTFTKAKKGKKNRSARKSSADDEDEPPAACTVQESGAIESKEMDVDDHNHSEQKPVIAKKPPAPMKFQSIDLDEDDPDMAQALARARRLALQAKQKADAMDTAEEATQVPVQDRGAAIAKALAAKIEPKVQKAAEEDDGTENIDVDGRRADGTLVFNSTTEFSTRLQAHLSDRARAKAEALMREVERRSEKERGHAGEETVHGSGEGSRRRAMSVDDSVSTGRSQERKSGQGEKDVDISGTMEDFEGLSDMEESDAEGSERGSGDEGVDGDDQLGFVHRQPLVAQSMAATLALLKGTGDLRQTEELAGRAKDSRQRDPSSVDLGVKIEYRDEFGRKLTQKEAFRQLSYKFHGYGPSQKKREKRLKALELQNKTHSSRAGILEGVGGTMKSLTAAQEATGRAHITIQGGATSAGAPTPLQLQAMISKKKGTSSSVKK